MKKERWRKTGRDKTGSTVSREEQQLWSVCSRRLIWLHTVTNCSNLHHMQYLFRARPKAVTGIRLIWTFAVSQESQSRGSCCFIPGYSCVCAVHLCCKCVERTTTLTLRFSLLDTWRLNTPHGHEMESTKVTLWFNPKVIFNVWHISLCL